MITCPWKSNFFSIYLCSLMHEQNMVMSYIVILLNQTQWKWSVGWFDVSIVEPQWLLPLEWDFQKSTGSMFTASETVCYRLIAAPNLFPNLSPDIVWLFVKHNCVNSLWRWDTKPFNKCFAQKVNLAAEEGANVQTKQQTVIFHCLLLCILMRLMD